MNKIYFAKYVPTAQEKYLKDSDGTTRMPITRTRTFALFFCALQICADVVGIGTSAVRGQVILLVLVNAVLIAGAIGGFLGALRLNMLLTLIHMMLSFLLVLVLLGTGIFTFVQDNTVLRLVLYSPALIDLAAAITSFVLYRNYSAVHAIVPSDDDVAAERALRESAAAAAQRAAADAAEAEAQRQRHREFEASNQKRMGRHVTDHDDNSLEDAGSNSSSTMEHTLECTICLSAKKNALLFPCHHCATCIDCANTFVFGESKCPLCRATIQKVEKIYL
jgi:hypothetical protein